MTGFLAQDVDTLAAAVPDGASLALYKDEGTGDSPLALIHALIRRKARNLNLLTIPTCAFPVSGLAADLLIGAGCVANVLTCGISLGEVGPAPCFTRAVKEGRIGIKDGTCPATYAALQAGAKGIPFMPLRGLIGSDVEKYRDDIRIIDNPFAENDPIAVLQAINPEVSIFHAEMADSEGNVWIGRRRDLITGGHASDKVLVTVEKIVPGSLFDDPRLAPALLPGFYVDQVALAPAGCWPGSLDGETDMEHIRQYADMARSEEGFAAYLERFVFAQSTAAE